MNNFNRRSLLQGLAAMTLVPLTALTTERQDDAKWIQAEVDKAASLGVPYALKPGSYILRSPLAFKGKVFILGSNFKMGKQCGGLNFANAEVKLAHCSLVFDNRI